MADDALFDVILRACIEQARQPDRFAGGIIGRAAAIVDALGLDDDLSVSTIRRKVHA